MGSLEYYAFLIVLGALAGFIGLVGQATAITQKSFIAALAQGAALCPITTNILNDLLWPGHEVTATMIGFLVGICQWSAVKPVVNIALKLLLDFGRALISQFRIK